MEVHLSCTCVTDRHSGRAQIYKQKRNTTAGVLNLHNVTKIFDEVHSKILTRVMFCVCLVQTSKHDFNDLTQ